MIWFSKILVGSQIHFVQAHPLIFLFLITLLSSISFYIDKPGEWEHLLIASALGVLDKDNSEN